jgi:hypothetical protein
MAESFFALSVFEYLADTLCTGYNKLLVRLITKIRNVKCGQKLAASGSSEYRYLISDLAVYVGNVNKALVHAYADILGEGIIDIYGTAAECVLAEETVRISHTYCSNA